MDIFWPGCAKFSVPPIDLSSNETRLSLHNYAPTSANAFAAQVRLINTFMLVEPLQNPPRSLTSPSPTYPLPPVLFHKMQNLVWSSFYFT